MRELPESGITAFLMSAWKNRKRPLSAATENGPNVKTFQRYYTTKENAYEIRWSNT